VRDHRLSEDAFPAIVAHRGASSTRPENTLAAFEEAVRVGASLVELDVRMSRDGVPVVMHDATVDRTTDGTGAVHELTAAEISALDAGEGERVPALVDALALLSGRAGVALEIKNLPGEPGYDPRPAATVDAVHAELERTAFEGAVLVISFNPASVAASKKIAPGVPTGLLSTNPVPPRDALAFAADAGHEMVLPGSRTLVPEGPSFVEDAHAAGVRVGTWTVDDAGLLRTLLDWGVDAMASNDPAMALGVVAERAG
jgi:glycerophosphoryl diester phosphodiesterase